MINTKEFWDFRDDESSIHRLVRTVVACNLGFKPPKPFGVCSCCPAARICCAVTKGRVAAALHRREQGDVK